MVPETAASLLAFLLFISPGLIFDWLRRRHRPFISRSGFEEIATVVISSLVFLAVAAVCLALINLANTELLASVWEWVRGGREYFSRQPVRSVSTVGVAVGLSWVAAIAANWALCQNFYTEKIGPRVRLIEGLRQDGDYRRLSPHWSLWNVLVDQLPEETKSVWLEVELAEGRMVWGAFYSIDTGGEPGEGMLILQKPSQARRSVEGEMKLDPPGHWLLVVLPIREIRSAQILYNTQPLA